ncbi:Inner membrane transport permease YadH [bacterium HR39]|nr:Inner membrane transport permease YadH [bacterium HR39]
MALRLLRGRASPGRAAAPTFGTPFDLNLVGLRTLIAKEVWRFLKVPAQTVVAPLVNALLFLVIFAFALGRAGRTVGELPYLAFLAPGLVMMSVIQNAFANTSSSLVIAKIQGNIVDYLMPPLSPGELLFGLVAGGVVRGFVVAAAVGVVLPFFVTFGSVDPLLALLYLLLASVGTATAGVLAGLWADKFDQLAFVTNFVIVPLSFLSGTFYSVAALPPALHLVALFDPFFHMIDGFRYALTGHADGAIWIGVPVLVLVDLGLWLLALHLLRIGWRLKS